MPAGGRAVEELRAGAERGEPLGTQGARAQRAFLSFARASCLAIT
jgi:hypothetical protein